MSDETSMPSETPGGSAINTDFEPIYQNLKSILGAVQKAYGLTRGQAVECLQLMVEATRDDASEVVEIGARFDWGVLAAVDRGEQWAIKVEQAILNCVQGDER
jgi:hypothetical protein